MKNTNKLHIKIKSFLSKINCPRFLHHFGPKKFEIAEHIFALQMKEICKISFRRLTNLLEMLGINCPTYSALCKSRKRIPKWIWNKLLRISSNLSSTNVGIDSTGFSQTNPSFHFVKRIDRKNPIKTFTKLSAFFDLDSRKFLALKIRVKPRHDIKDFPSLFNQFRKFKNLFGDSAYDAESIHEKCLDEKIQTFIKPRKNIKRGFYRRKQKRFYDENIYHKRSLIESGFGSLKRKYGGNVSAKKSLGIVPEIYLKAINHNMNLMRV
jgi:transposase